MKKELVDVMDKIIEESVDSNVSAKVAPGLTLLSIDNPVFCCYLFWFGLLTIKMLIMSLLTAAQRFGTKAFVNPEDLKLGKTEEVKFNEPGVERVRRAHRNDLENILPFFIIGLAYVATGPNPTLARTLCRVAALARLLHTAVYAFRPVPQPSRAIAFFTCLLITIYMAFHVIAHTIRHI